MLTSALLELLHEDPMETRREISDWSRRQRGRDLNAEELRGLELLHAARQARRAGGGGERPGHGLRAEAGGRAACGGRRWADPTEGPPRRL